MTQAYNLSQLANNVNSSGELDASIGLTNAVPIANGGTGATSALNAKVALEIITDDTGSEILPSGTTAQRDGTPQAGYIRFNTDTGQFEGYNGTAWGTIGGGATGGGGNQVFVENDQTITADYTIPSTKNAMTTGIITINAGVTVTVQDPSNWVIL